MLIDPALTPPDTDPAAYAQLIGGELIRDREAEYNRLKNSVEPETVLTSPEEKGFWKGLPKFVEVVTPYAEHRNRVRAGRGPGRYTAVLGVLQLPDVLPTRPPDLFAWDIETNTGDVGNPRGLDLLGLSLSWEPHQAVYFPRELAPKALEVIDEWYRTGVGLVHNAKFDLGVTAGNLPLDVFPWVGRTVDTALAAAVGCESQAGLKYLIETRLGETPLDFDAVTSGIPFDQLPLELQTRYACQDSDATFRLWPLLKRRIDAYDLQPILDLEMACLPAFMKMEEKGVPVDLDYIDQLRSQKEPERARLRDLLRTVLQVENPDSADQLRDSLFNKLGLAPTKFTPGGKPSVSTPALQLMAARNQAPPIVRLLIEYKKLNKWFDAFLDPIPAKVGADGRLRGSFRQLGARTGRTSMVDPNIQQWPAELRPAVVGDITTIDYEQIELRILAAESGDERMLSAFRRGFDIHTQTQQQVGLPDRRMAKVFNFGVSYGAHGKKLAEMSGLSEREGERFVNAYWRTYSGVERWVLQNHELAPSRQARTRMGRLRVLSGDPAEVLREAVNTPIQGGAGDVAKIALSRLPAGVTPIMFMHDEIVFENLEEVEEVCRVMREAGEEIYPEVPMPVKPVRAGHWSK